MFYSTLKTPIGQLFIGEENDKISFVLPSDQGETIQKTFGILQKCDTPTINECKSQLNSYFEKKLTKFDLPMSFSATPFQKKVYQELAKIPFGETVTYKDLAEKAGNEKASRAVGGAVGRNNHLILIPCHRVLGQNSLGGFSCGLDKKIILLNHENIPFKI